MLPLVLPRFYSKSAVVIIFVPLLRILWNPLEANPAHRPSVTSVGFLLGAALLAPPSPAGRSLPASPSVQAWGRLAARPSAGVSQAPLRCLCRGCRSGAFQPSPYQGRAPLTRISTQRAACRGRRAVQGEQARVSALHRQQAPGRAVGPQPCRAPSPHPWH